MPYFEIEFIDGKSTTIEADAYPEQHDSEWVFLRSGRVVGHYQTREVRGVQELPPLRPPSRGGGGY